MRKILFALISILFLICVYSCAEVKVVCIDDGQNDESYNNSSIEQDSQTTTVHYKQYKLTIIYSEATTSNFSESVTDSNVENYENTTTSVTSETVANEGALCHYPAEGQGLREIADIYGCDYQTLLQYNGLDEDSIIYSDQPIWIPPITNNRETDENYNVDEQQNNVGKHEPGYYAGTTYTSDYNSLLNIEHSCSDLNGMIVPAYSEFSWFKCVGPCIEGYEEAAVIDESYIPSSDSPYPTARGGGICVTSSCLRNAAEAVVGFQNILEAHNHTQNGQPINMSYAPVGQQASLNYGTMDFRFYNPYPYSLKIEAFFDWNTQTCYVSVVPE